MGNRNRNLCETVKKNLTVSREQFVTCLSRIYVGLAVVTLVFLIACFARFVVSESETFSNVGRWMVNSGAPQ